MSISTDDLIGTWSLVEFWIDRGDDSPLIAPFGDDAQGRLVYSPDGHMATAICDAHRQPFLIDTLERSAKASESEKAEAFDTFVSYVGTYRVEDGKVIHTVELASMPNIVGRERVRDAAFDDGDLVLTYDLETPVGQRRYTLRWERI